MEQGAETVVLPSRSKALPFIPEGYFPDGLHKPIALVLASAYILGTACLLSGKPPKIDSARLYAFNFESMSDSG